MRYRPSVHHSLNHEDDNMSSEKPSRRQLLCGILATLAGLFAWLWPGTTKAADKKPQPKKKLLTDKLEAAISYSYDSDARLGPLGTVTSYTYDALGRLISVREETRRDSLGTL